MRRRSGTRALAAVLFTDIVDSTAVASRLGDARWKELIARHHAIVRRELKRFGGRELDTAGDGFFASFSEPAAAIRCACAASESVRELGIEIRTGVHFGECEQVGGKLGGIAVVVGARVMSLGGPGDVLVTASTSDLVAGAGFGFQDRGTNSLKGVDGQWHVLAVTEVDGEPRAQPAEPEEAERRLAAVQPSAVLSRHRWRKGAAAVAAFALLASLVAVTLVRDAGGSSEITPNSVGVMDRDSGEVSATVGLEDRPGSVAGSADAVWVTNPDVGTVTRIDPNDQEVRDTIPVGENPTGIAVGEGALWVVESGGPSVSRISLETNEVVDTIAVGNGPSGVAVGDGSVWVTNRFDGTISRIDPDPDGVVEEIPVGPDPRGIAIGFGSAWVALSGANTVVRVDPQTNEQTEVVGVGNAPGSLAVSADAVWVANTLDDTVMRISPDTNSVVGTVQVGDGPSGIAVVDRIVWVANEADATLSRIEPGEMPGQSSVRTLVVGSVPQGIDGVNGGLWVSVRGAAISHRGGALRMVSLDPPSSLDPANVDEDPWLVRHLLGDGLVAFEPIGGLNSTLVPDLATSIPTPTDGGRTYTFELREGIRYSNGEVVAPSDFRRALERALRLRASGAPVYYGLVGGEACGNEPETCDLSEGIETDDVTRTITFHLVAPDPDFLYKLTLPPAYPLPPSVPDEEQLTSGIPGTGPYMLEAPMTSEALALVRNPHFRVWSPAAQPDGYVDRIEWSFGVEYEAQVEAVAAGDADLALDAWLSEGLAENLVRFPAQVHISSTDETWFVVLNTEAPPFDNVEVRRALNLALDRDRVAQIAAEFLGGGVLPPFPTCQTIPPNFPGYEPHCPYTMDPGPKGDGSWTAPDLEEAQKLVNRSGTAGMPVVFEYDNDWKPLGPSLGDYMVELLEDLGYRGSVRPFPHREFYRPGREFQMALTAWIPLYPAASEFIASLHKCGANYLAISSGFCDPAIDAMIDRAIEIQLEDPAAAGALWAETDREVVDQAPYLWLLNPQAASFVSERVGNYQQSPQWGVLLNQLWVR